jgi:integrase
LTEICTPAIFGSFSRQKIELEHKKTACPIAPSNVRCGQSASAARFARNMSGRWKRLWTAAWIYPIKEYILRGRPPSKSEYLFLRAQEPYRRLSSGVPIDFLFKEYQQKAGIERNLFDWKGSHSMRRSMGKNMVQSKVPVETVAQALGHEDLDATQRYIALDTEHLRECALSADSVMREVSK